MPPDGTPPRLVFTAGAPETNWVLAGPPRLTWAAAGPQTPWTTTPP